MNKEQPEALWLADALEAINEHNADSLLALNVIRQAGPELRRLHAENEALRAQIGQGEPDGLFESQIEPRPLLYPLSDYHRAMTDGPLHYTWIDKPHRLVYDLIAAVRYYASAPPAPQQKPLLFSEIWDNDAIMEVNADARLPFEMIERFVRAIEAAHGIKGD